MKSDIEISRETPLRPIVEIGATLGLSPDDLILYGKHKAKIPYTHVLGKSDKRGKLVLVSAITPTKAGIGKTTTSVGLVLGLQKIGKNAVVALREPSLGPCFGMKGGAAGGGYAQVLPMEDINLHFTGDFHAITAANNLLAALIDNYQYQHEGTDKMLKRVLWRRVLDVNDRALRQIITSLGNGSNGTPTETGFDITAASELMAILCLADGYDDLRKRIDSILVGYTQDNRPFYVRDLGVSGALVVLLKDALHPNLVQTTENTPALIHGGPFANIAHGCNSVLATKMALALGDIVVTEAGFGADLGAEKFLNIKCRAAGLQPDATVLVVTSQALKLHGGVAYESISKPDLAGLQRGLPNLERHIENMQGFGQSVVVAFNQYGFDTAEEMDFLRAWCAERGVRFAVNNSFSLGGNGALELAEAVVQTLENKPSAPLAFTYALEDAVETKIEKIVQRIYRGASVVLGKKARTALAKIKKNGWANLPICIAKTQYSFSDDAKHLNAPSGFELTIEDLIVNTGAGFIVAVAGDIMRMPGLPEVPQANYINLVNGLVEGLS